MSAVDTRRATCVDCGHTTSLAGLALHDCTIAEQGGRCEDYPCCGHTDGDGCQTLPTHTADYYRRNPALTHLGCDHNTGYCDYEEEAEPESDEEFGDAMSGVEYMAYERDAEFDALPGGRNY